MYITEDNSEMIINVKKVDCILLPIRNMNNSLKKSDKLKANGKTSFGTFLTVNSARNGKKPKMIFSDS